MRVVIMKSSKIVALLFASLFSGSVLAANCSVDVDANDAMQFSTKNIDVDKSCKDFTVNLKHTGSLPKNVMGHNLVITKTADFKAVMNDGTAAGEAGDFVKAGDARVIAHTKLIGGGEKDSVKFDASKLTAGEKYTFFCSFPGHATMMRGTVTVK